MRDRHALEPLGRAVHCCGVVLRGHMRAEDWEAFLGGAAGIMGMHPVAAPARWHYPVTGLGGNGDTIVQPITESFLIVDTWPDHSGAYLFICSCKPFSLVALLDFCGEHGLHPYELFEKRLGLP